MLTLPPAVSALGRGLLTAALALSGISSCVLAAGPTFPYEAVVQTAEVEVRAGPGQRYYVTGKLRQNDRVTVHRHDPGGWYMIAPPPGSFSWIEATLVQQTGTGTGIVKTGQGGGPALHAVVRIGSEYSNDHAYFGRELTAGDTVRILGEQTLNTESGPVHMFKIAPPPFEYRWIKGDFIVPASGDAPAATAPVAAARLTEPVAAADFPATPPRPATDPVADPFPATSAATPAPATVSAAAPLPTTVKDRLAKLDERFLALGELPPEQWNLEQITSDYESLLPAADALQASVIEQRLQALAGRRKIWQEYQDFVRLTEQTTQRDAALQAAQSGSVVSLPPVSPVAGEFSPERPVQAVGTGSQPTPLLAPTPIPGHPSSGPRPRTGSRRQLSDNPDASSATTIVQRRSVPPSAASPQAPLTPIPIETLPAATPAATSQHGVAGPLSGAGIVQRLPGPPGAPAQYLLTDPRGRPLALLQPGPGIQLDLLIGQPVGVVGPRGFDARLRADLIQVRQTVPVQLAP